MSWAQLEHRVWAQIIKHKLRERTLILTVSGGLDSIVLLHVIRRLNLKGKVIVAHFHHGSSGDHLQDQFRTTAMDFVKKHSGEFEFTSAQAEKCLTSEADFRRERQVFIRSIRDKNPHSIVVTAHHQNDVLETYFLKMIRGSGVEGFKNFTAFNGSIWRPFLECQKSELNDYAQKNSLNWLEDPSNLDRRFLRNWLRHELFPVIEKKQISALRNMSNSLGYLVKSASTDSIFASNDLQKSAVRLNYKTDSCIIEIDRPWYKVLSIAGKERVLFMAFKQAQLEQFQRKMKLSVSNQEKSSAFWDIRKGRVKEIIKRLDKNQKDIKFSLGQLKALTSSEKIVLEFSYVRSS